MLNGKTFSYNGETVTPKSKSTCNPRWLELMEAIETYGVEISESGVEFSVDDTTFRVVVEADDTAKLFVNDFPIPENNIDNYFIYSGMRNPRVLNMVPLVNRIIESAPGFVNIDFAKQIRSKVFGDMSVTVFKPERSELVAALKHQGAINETKLYKNLNVLQLKELVTGFMGFDISESFSEWLPALEADALRVEREQKTILDQIQGYRDRLTRISSEWKSLSETSDKRPVLESLSKSVSDAISDLKEKYNRLATKKKTLNEGLTDSTQTGHQWGDKKTPGTAAWDYGESGAYDAMSMDSDPGLDWLTKDPTIEGHGKLYPNQTVQIKSKGIIGKLINIDYVNDFATVLPAGGMKTIICRPDQLQAIESNH
jgi:hypothetical protein